MNESASKSSLTSPSGKPSTANSAGSPNGRKTRTILVARTIADEPTKVTHAATRLDGHNSAVSLVVNQHHSRDARSGKLASYAALGGAEDVERFDQFLAEQRGQPSASELRAAATSPHHVTASMKRKTMSRIQLEGIDGKLSDAAAGGDAVTRKLMQQELENDARKRREEAVAHRRWLNSLPIHERVAQQRQHNALRKWRQMSRDWEKFKARAAQRLGKAPQELVMSRASAYREQREMYDTLQKARPLNDKVGEDIWLVSLRNVGTRYVPVGNIFSGLFCPIREITKLGPRVRRPLDYYDNQENRQHETSRSMSKLEKRSLNLLERKKWRLRKQLEILQPHEVDRSATSHLSVQTIDLFAWASGATDESSIEGDDDLSVRAYSAGVDDVTRGQRQRSYANPSSPMPVVKEDSPFIGPSLRIAHVFDGDEVPISNPESDGALVGNWPESCLPPLRLSFYTAVGEQVQRSLSITNDGNTIVHYQWWRTPFEDEDAELTMHLRGNRTLKEEQELERFWTTSVSKLGGTLLPLETQQFVFTFESSKAGMFLEKWLLGADPQPRICLGMTRVDTDADSVELPVEVRLSCVAEDNFVGWSKRKLQLARVQQKEGHFFVANLVDEILDGVKSPEPVVFNKLMSREDVTKFYEQNGFNEFSDVYFSPDLVRDCCALFERAQGILRALSPVQDPVIEEEYPNKEDALGSGGAEGVEKPKEGVSTEQKGSTDGLIADTEVQQMTTKSAPLPAYLVEEWNWRLETLCELCKMADDAQNLQIGRLTQLLKKEIEEVEEEEENEDDDEDEADDAEEEQEEEDVENDGSSAEKNPRISPREMRKIERLARRKTIEDEISALQSKLQETFDMMRFSAYTAPYNITRLQERMHEKIGNLCSETPVVCEIANVVNVSSNLSIVQAAKVDGVGKLLMRAIDEAIGGDQDHQVLLEQERRRIQSMWLGDKVSYLSISEWLAKDTALMNQLLPILSATEPQREGTDIPPTAQNIDHFDNSGVILMQIDLDLAPWFSLVKMETKEAITLVDEPPKFELAWRFSQELTQHTIFVPAKVARAAESLEKLLNALSTAKPAVHTVLLVSELSRPPLTRQMLKLLRSAAQDKLKVKALATNQAIGEPEEGKSQGGAEQNDGAEVATMNSILQRLFLQLSLRDVAPVVQRAIQKEVVFCSAAEEVQAQIDFGRKKLLLNSSVSLDQIENDATSKNVEVDGGMQGERVSPRILLLEHLDTAGILTLHAIQQRELAASKPATPAPPETQKPAVSGKKSSVTVPGKGKSSTQAAPAAPTPAPTAETPPPSIHDLMKLDFAGKDFREQGFMALRNMFTRMVSACVLDGIPSPSHESVFSFKLKKNHRLSPPPTFAGPTLSKELDTWSQSLQPAVPSIAQPRVLTAIVGGKCLESKIRLIDGLLEFVREIYFVGEVAVSLYRVLHTKQARNSATHSHVGMSHGEDDAELDEGTDLTNVAGSAREDTLEGKPNVPANEKEIGDLPRGRAHYKGIWDLLVPAVEKLQQKASRKCVHLLLPIDLIVGETPLEEQDLTATTVDDDDDDDEDEDEADEEGDEDNGKKSRKRQSAKQKHLVEPNHVDVFEQLHQGVYEGERAHVVVSPASRTKSSFPDAGWREFKDVTAQCLANARVIEGKRSILASLWRDDADEETEDESTYKPSPARFEYEWTFRALDVGPIAMDGLAKQLKQGTRSEDQVQSTHTPTQSRGLIISGVCGAVEFHEFCTATKQLLQILQGYSPSEVFIAGGLTASWLRQLETEQLNYVATGEEKRNSDANASIGIPVAPTSMRKVVDDRAMRNARVLKQLVAAKPHPILANLVSSDSI